MKKLLGLLLSISITFFTFAQAPSFPNQNLNNSNALTIFGYLGGLTSNGYKPKQFSDTTAANAAAYLKFTPYIVIAVGDNLYMRNGAITQWILVGGVNISTGIVNYIDSSLNVINQILGLTSTTTRLLTGSVYKDTLMDFIVTDLTYLILGKYYTSTATTFTFNPADEFLDRYSIVVVDTLGNIIIRDGAAAIPAQIPLPTQYELLLGTYFIPASATSTNPISTDTTGYFDGAEANYNNEKIVFTNHNNLKDSVAFPIVYIKDSTGIETTRRGDTMIIRATGAGLADSMYFFRYVLYDSVMVFKNTSGDSVTVVIRGSGGSGVTSRFGIEDNTGVQDREINMQNKYMWIYGPSTFDIDVNGGDGTFNTKSSLALSPTYGTIITQKPGHQNSINTLPDAIEMSSSGDSTRTIRITDTSIIYRLNLGVDKYLPLTINGVEADITGNVTIATGGSTLDALTNVTITGKATGDMIYWNGSAWVNLAIGAANQHLIGGTNPHWGDTAVAGSGSGTINTGTANRLGYYATTGTALSELAAITANRALISDANGLPTHATTTATEIGYVNGVTSSIQAQIDAKQGALSGTGYSKWSGSTPSYIAAIPIADGGTNITSYTTGDILYASATNVLSKLAAGTDGHVLTLASGVPSWAAAGGGSGWATTGNSGLTWASNFLGTTDAVTLRFRTNNIERLKIDSATGALIQTYGSNNSFVLLSNPLLIPPTSISGDFIMGYPTAFNSAATNSISIGNGNTTGTGTGNLSLGYAATASGGGVAISAGAAIASTTGGIAIGNNTYAGASGSIAMGVFSDARSTNPVAIGYVATATAAHATAIGSTATATGTSSGAFGHLATATNNYSMAFGFRAKTTATNQFVAGGSQTGGVGGITDVYFGSGPSGTMAVGDTAAGISYTIHGSGAGLGTTTSLNKNGGNLTLAGGKGTGSGTPGDLIFSTPTSAASSSTLQSLTQRWWIKASTGQLSNNATPDASSLVDIQGTTTGTLLQRMTKVQRDAITSPAQGLLVFVTDNGGYLSWYNSGWQKISSVAD